MANLSLFFLLTLVLASDRLLQLADLDLLHPDRMLQLQGLLLQKQV